MPAAAGVNAPDPKSRFAEVRRKLDRRFSEVLDHLRDELAQESPEVRAEALAWLNTQTTVTYDMAAQYINLALCKIRMAEVVESVCGPDPQETRRAA